MDDTSDPDRNNHIRPFTMAFSSKPFSNSTYELSSQYPRQSYSPAAHERAHLSSITLVNPHRQHQSCIYDNQPSFIVNQNSCKTPYYDDVRAQVGSKFCDCGDFTHAIHATLPTRSIKLLTSDKYADPGPTRIGHRTITIPTKPPRHKVRKLSEKE